MPSKTRRASSSRPFAARSQPTCAMAFASSQVNPSTSAQVSSPVTHFFSLSVSVWFMVVLSRLVGSDFRMRAMSFIARRRRSGASHVLDRELLHVVVRGHDGAQGVVKVL